MKLFDVYPINDITIERGLGSYLWDTDGIQYLDMYGGHAVISIGHSHPLWTAALQDQLQRIAFYSNSIHIPLQQELATRLGSVSGKEDYQLFMCNSGAEANENALKLASFHTGRRQVVAFTKGFHGRTSLAVAATDNPAIVAPVNATDNVVILPFNDVEALERYFARQGKEIAAVIVEGIQGVGGIQEASVDFLQAIRQLCTQYGAVYVADSVQCGYGRTGQFFAHDIADADADIYSMAKGMGNGFPVGGILIAPHIKPKHGMLGTTFGGNHLACAASIAVLDVIESENLLEKAKQRGMYLKNKLARMDAIAEIRGRGLMLGFEMQPGHPEVRKALLQQYHIFTGEAKPATIRLLPALTIQRRHMDEFLDAMAEITTTEETIAAPLAVQH